MRTAVTRRLPIGAEVTSEGVHVRVWAPQRRRVEVVVECGAPGTGVCDRAVLQPEGNGYFAGLLRGAGVGSLYRFRLDDDEQLYPDPATRFQPHGPHGPSRVVDATSFRWSDSGWPGIALDGQVMYELHAGTFTAAGTWAAASRELPELRDAGITVIELMPIAEFSGGFGWGYDGVDLFAPSHLYGEPDDLRRFIDHAHACGIGVILDVVYNHLGPDGNYLEQFSPDYFTDRYTTEWGASLNYDGEDAAPVREFFLANAGYWIDEFHFDGLRLDATQNIYDASREHILAAITREVRRAAGRRSVVLVAENEPQDTRIVRPFEQDGYGMDALWNDDFHHTAMVALTGHNEAYYSDYRGTPQEIVSAVKRGYLYQGQHYLWQHKRRGTPTTGVPPAAFITYLQNHDQVSNSVRGERVNRLTSPGRLKALTALLLLGPGTPMLFQGQEFGASSPFAYFADHNPDLARLVRNGRLEFLSQFPSIANPEARACIPDPSDRAAFERARLDLSERERHAELYTFHRDLLKLRREDPVFRAQGQFGIDGAVLSAEACVLRFFGEQQNDRLLVLNLGRDLLLRSAPEPLLAPPRKSDWALLWSSEDPRYGGCGTAQIEAEEGWHLPGEAAVVLAPQRAEKSGDG